MLLEHEGSFSRPKGGHFLKSAASSVGNHYGREVVPRLMEPDGAPPASIIVRGVT